MADRGNGGAADARGRALWLAVMAALVLAGGAVPYGLLAGPAPGLAVAGFWVGFGIAVIAMIAVATLRWRD